MRLASYQRKEVVVFSSEQDIFSRRYPSKNTMANALLTTKYTYNY